METNTDRTNPMKKVFLLIAVQILCTYSFAVNAQRIFFKTDYEDLSTGIFIVIDANSKNLLNSPYNIR